jgi:hypothetical protein
VSGQGWDVFVSQMRLERLERNGWGDRVTHLGEVIGNEDTLVVIRARGDLAVHIISFRCALTISKPPRRYQFLGKAWLLKEDPMVSTERTPSVPEGKRDGG